MHIRKATIDDAPDAFEIRNLAILSQCKGHYSDDILTKWTDGELPTEFAHAFAKYGFVSEIENKVVGVGMLDVDNGMVDAIFVRPESFGKGLGKRMLMHLEAQARRVNCKELRLDATLNAAAFYRSCGFEGHNQSVWHSPRGIDLACIPMVKVL
ncbi:GNAT family N-acetyltransferase [Shewanella sp. 1_MG-2023]|uniref:GNAT family N-acetyltransferase n=1 Tax=unclassified Shewanella TaxID=196818 RepID=UPI001E57E533|nr:MULTISPECIES: GNAT family N-acetyltransferase [unclassified Shewanella]MCC4834590.1 GNAT family N-acetyltransferase [Shewanella sp. 10N.7]MDO6613699.1 GNAT family N-acetyltransferase [Shewanella sp. 7_MG-2023]MDO6773445.1 GNAT family N-acetyltransferase [Shewanella sp. 2_MG-2023]MDO6796305.1 GNAT family N-acetyltransferase [Shewanella sp. 1_MG-2023]